MKRLALLIAALVVVLGASAQESDSIVGTYLSHDRDARFEVYGDGNLYQGRTVWSEHRPDDVGTITLRNLRYDADKREYTGKIFDPRFDKEYNVRVTVLPDGNLKVTPWWGIVKMNFTWTRTASEA